MNDKSIEIVSGISQSGNDDIYNYLVEKLEGTGAKIEILDNGGIYVKNWVAQGNSVNELYIPPNIDSNNVSMVSYIPGDGGAGSCANPLRNKINSDTPPDYIITISNRWQDYGNTMEAATSICSENGLEVTNVTLQSFSMSGGLGLQKMETYLENHPDVNATYIAADGYNFNHGYTKNLDSLVERGIPIILVNPENDTRLVSECKKLGQYGLNIYVIESSRRGHGTINADIINNGLLEYSLGISDEFGGPYNTLDECKYKIYQYERLADGEEPASGEDIIRNNAQYILIDDFSVMRQENETYGYTLERLKSNPFDDGSVGADMYGVVTSLNNIRQSIGESEMVAPTHTSTSTIPSNLVNAETSLLGISSDLNGTIYKETQVISSIAQVFYDMDRERTNAANDLSNGSGLFDESAYIDVLNQLVSYDISSELKFDSFMFDPFSHTEGNSGKICLSDLNAMLSGGSLAGPLHENLENERQSARATQTELDNLNAMISSGANFKGEVWKAVGKRLTDYSDLMSLRIESADKLESAIAEAIKLIVDYMGEYDELDDSKLPELKENAEQIKQSILDAENIINATHNVSVPVEDGNGATTYRYITEYVYSTSARSQAKDFIYKASILLREINKEINKLENLPIVLAKAEQIINDALTEIYGNYGVKVGNAVTGKTVSYIPPQNTNYVAPQYTKVETFNPVRRVEGKVDQGTFYMRPELQAQYGSYEDYLNGVTRENNPMFNSDMEDKGIEPGQTLNDKIFDEPEQPQEEDITETPDPEEETGDTPDDPQPSTPSDPKPSTPSNPQPDTPSDPQPDTPSDPQPDTPSDPQPDTPSDPQPDTPSDPQPDTPSDPQPDTPSDPQPDTPSDPQPDTPSDPQPDTPSDPQPDTPSDPKPSVPSGPSKPENNPGTPNTGDNSSVDIPGESETPSVDVPPIVEIPDEPIIDEPIVDTPVVDDKPIIDITPNTGNDNNNSSSSNNEGIDLTKAIGVSLGVGAAVGAAALGAHTVKKAKDNNIYEDD